MGRRPAPRGARRRRRRPAAGRRDHRRRPGERRRSSRSGSSTSDAAPTRTRAPDQLAADDRAWAIVPPDRPRQHPRSSARATRTSRPPCRTSRTPTCSASRPTDYPADARRTDGTDWDLIIFEGSVPATLPRRPDRSRSRRPRRARSATVSGTLDEPGDRVAVAGRADPALRRPVDDPHRRGRRSSTLPAWARTVIPGPKGAPLLYAGVRAGVPSAVLAFEPRHSPTCRSRSRSRS